MNIIQCMVDYKIENIIFSSSATTYGHHEFLPVTEEHPLGNVTARYGRSKYFIEMMLKDIARAHENFNAVCLRYFNPIGTHESGRIGEDPTGVPRNLMPYISQVATGRLKEVNVFGSD